VTSLHKYAIRFPRLMYINEELVFEMLLPHQHLIWSN